MCWRLAYQPDEELMVKEISRTFKKRRILHFVAAEPIEHEPPHPSWLLCSQYLAYGLGALYEKVNMQVTADGFVSLALA